MVVVTHTGQARRHGDAERNSDRYGKSDYCFRPTFSTLRM